MKHLIALSLLDLPLHVKSKLFLIFNNNFDILFNSKSNFDFIKTKNFENFSFDFTKINKFSDWERVDKLIEYSIKNEFRLITPNDSVYPNILLEIPDFPIMLYTKGNTNLLNSNCLSVVGSRVFSSYANMVLDKFIPSIVKSAYTIVSGMAIGVDSIAHKICLKNGGNTIAVLGTGVNLVYPATNKNLYDSILNSNGLIVSEYGFGTPAYPKNFPVRNRIIAGLSKNIIIVEARLKSGSLITARLAMEYNRNVFSVPGSIFSNNSEGTNELIKSGASLLNKLEDLNISFANNSKTTLNNDEIRILDLINTKGVDFNYLLSMTSLDIAKLSCLLDNLENNKLIYKDDFDMFYKL